MKTKLSTAGIFLSTACALATLAGCCSGRHDHCEQQMCSPFNYGCFGYHSTCWRPWPEECPTCPSFAIIPPPHEELINDMPYKQEALPPAVSPAPPEEESLPPVIEPQEGRAQPRGEVQKVSRKRIRVVPADNR